MRVAYETFFLEAQARADEEQKDAVCWLVGLGTGAWAVNTAMQEEAIEEVIIDIFHTIHLPRIAELRQYSQRTAKKNLERKQGAGLPAVHWTRGNLNPGDTIMDNQILVRLYAWDGNAFPGNEFWVGLFDGSDDPAAACSSTILSCP